VVRSLRDWAASVRQGMALVTYRSNPARERVLRDLTSEFQAKGWKTERLECGGCSAEDFVRRIAGSESDALFVLDADRLLFGENAERSPFWVNFQRETLAGYPGVQIWWMRPNAAIRFGQQLPDLGRFFLFREDLKEEEEAQPGPSPALQIASAESSLGDPDKARDLLQRALRAAGGNSDPTRVWLELGIPAINEFLRSDEVNEALEAFRQLTGLVGAPEEALKRASGPGATGDLGAAFLTLWRLYREVGRGEDALAAAEDAVRIYRELEPARDDTLRSGLGAALADLAIELSVLGRREEAGERAEEAVRVYRELAQHHADAFLPDLAMSLNNQAIMLSGLGRREEALAPAEESVRIRRQLTQQRPDAFLPDLAVSVINLADRLSAVGRYEEALEQAEESVRIHRLLARQRAGAFLPGLAASLISLANMLSALGRREEALAPADEAVRIYRQLAQQRPGAFLRDLAMSLSNLAAALSALGRREEALAPADEAVRVDRQLVQQRPEAFLPDLAASLNNLAAVLSDLGRREEALAPSEEAVRIRRQLAQQQPDAFLPDLARSLAVHGRALLEERPAEAMEPLAEAIRLLTPFFSRLPQAHAPLMQGLCSVYLQAAQSANLAPDNALLGPVAAIFEKLGSPLDRE